MARIFSVLAMTSVMLLAANFVVGLNIGDFNAAAQRKAEVGSRFAELRAAAKRGEASARLEDAKQALIEADTALQEPKSRKDIHMLLGVAAALMTVLVNSITITYFIGTSRWCKEVCQSYSIASDLAAKSARLKRSNFPWALAGIVAVIAIVALGAAADPSGANFARSSSFVLPHYVAAMIGLVVVIAAFCVQAGRIVENTSTIERILAEVQRIRAEKNLPMEDAATP